jgi:hypothetical protein
MRPFQFASIQGRLARGNLRALPLLAVAVAAVAGGLLLGCTPRPAIRQEILMGDREREWGLVYYQSWQKERNREYLVMARQRTQEAVRLYLDVQRRMGYSYPDFYIVDRRRMASCTFLRQVQLEASSSAVKLDDTARKGCFDP